MIGKKHPQQINILHLIFDSIFYANSTTSSSMWSWTALIKKIIIMTTLAKHQMSYWRLLQNTHTHTVYYIIKSSCECDVSPLITLSFYSLDYRRRADWKLMPQKFFFFFFTFIYSLTPTSAEHEKMRHFTFHIQFSDKLAFSGPTRRCCQYEGERLLSLSDC